MTPISPEKGQSDLLDTCSRAVSFAAKVDFPRVRVGGPNEIARDFSARFTAPKNSYNRRANTGHGGSTKSREKLRTSLRGGSLMQLQFNARAI